MKLRYLLGLFLATALLAAAVTVWLAIELKETLDRATVAEIQEYESILLAEELRQTSNDLTRFARMFVQTGDERFASYFQKILAMRNGEQPFPDDYASIYWDRVVVGDDTTLDTGTGEAISFYDRMVEMGFADSELGLLAESQRLSDELALIEEQAFHAVRGLYPDEDGNYTETGQPDLEKAQRLLYSEDYLQAKADIMEPIAAFELQVSERTAAALAMARSEADEQLLSLFVSTGALFLLLVVLTLIVHYRVLVRARDLAEAATHIAAGELNTRSDVRGRDELGVLGKTFDDMVSQLAETLALVTAVKDRMQGELDIGREIQMSMVPLIFPAFPDHPEFTVYAVLKPAREVGGDFYDFYFIDEDRFCICIGDVSGKGVPSALFMAVAKTLIKSWSNDNFSTGDILTNANTELANNNKESMFVTLFLAIINTKTGDAVFTNAGHNPPFVRHGDGSLQRLDERHGPVVGAVPDIVYGENRIQLDTASIMFVYTDGVTEAIDANETLFTEARLVELLETTELDTAEKIVETTVLAVKEFEGDVEQTDDVTVLAFQLNDVLEEPMTAARHVEIRNDQADIAKVIAAFEAFAEESGLPKPLVMKFGIVFDELLSNVISYGFDDDKAHAIDVDMEKSGKKVTVTIIDDGRPFDPLTVDKPDTGSALEDRDVGGLGVHLVRNLVADVTYERRIDKNVTILTAYVE